MANATKILDAISNVAQIGGTLVQAFGQFKQAESAQQVAQFNAAIALRNAKLVQQAANLELARGKEQKASFTARQIVAFAKAGVRQEGTPADVIAESAAQFEMDLQIDFFNAQIAANRELSQSQVDLAQADDFRRMKFLKPLATGIGGLANLSFKSGLTETREVNKPTKLSPLVRRQLGIR